MTRGYALMVAAGGIAGALALGAAQQPSALAQAQPGLWEISGVPDAKGPVRQCVADIAVLARFEHRTKSCSARMLKDAGGSAEVDYSCGGAGFGHSQIDVLTPRSLRVSTQGISDGLPFNYVLQAHRLDECPKSASAARH
ncbi:MAG: DUF3617 domain-containing protein [Sphingomonas sp.]